MKNNYFEKAYRSYVERNSNDNLIKQMLDWFDFPVIVTDPIYRIQDNLNCDGCGINIVEYIKDVGFIDQDVLRTLAYAIDPNKKTIPSEYVGSISVDGQSISIAILSTRHRSTRMCVLFAFRCGQGFSDEEIDMLKKCGYLLMSSYAVEHFEASLHKNFQDQNVMNLLRGEFKHEREMENQFLCTQILKKKYFYVILIGHTSDYVADEKNRERNHSLGYHMAYFKGVFKNAYSIVYDKIIVAIMSTNKTNKEYTNYLLSMREYVDREGLFMISSNPALTIKDIPVLFSQVQKGLEFLDCENRPFCNVAFYRQYALRHLYQFGEKDNGLRYFCHPAVLELDDYDKANHTDYLHTLYCYLRYNQQLTLTAREMYIHRNTLSYRLEKIFEMTNLNRDNGTELAHVLVSIEIYFNGYPPVLKNVEGKPKV